MYLKYVYLKHWSTTVAYGYTYKYTVYKYENYRVQIDGTEVYFTLMYLLDIKYIYIIKVLTHNLI